MKEMEFFLLELESGLNDLEDKVTRLNELLEIMHKNGALDTYETILQQKGITLSVNPN